MKPGDTDTADGRAVDERTADGRTVGGRAADGRGPVDDFADDIVDADAVGDATETAETPDGVHRPVPAEPRLTERERQVLAFERNWWRHAGAKEQAIRDTFGLSSTRYYQVLNDLLDKPAALAHDPVLVGRLRRLRSARVRSRTGTGRVA
jgi:hypothetical protein